MGLSGYFRQTSLSRFDEKWVCRYSILCYTSRREIRQNDTRAHRNKPKLLRFDVAENALKITRFRELLSQSAERLPKAFVVLEADKARIRPLT